MVIHDDSTVKAIIKSGLTRFHLRSIDRAARLMRVIGDIKSNTRLYDELKKALRDEFAGYAIYELEGGGGSLLPRRTWTAVYLDLDVSLRYSSADYPSVFYATLTTLTLRKVRQPPKIYPIVSFHQHMLERVVRREQCNTLEAAMPHLAPLTLLAMEMDMRGTPYRQWGKFVAISATGYAICSVDETTRTPLVVTWVPRRWWTRRRCQKLHALEAHLRHSQSMAWAFMSAESFNSTEAVALASMPDEHFMQIPKEVDPAGDYLLSDFRERCFEQSRRGSGSVGAL